MSFEPIRLRTSYELVSDQIRRSIMQGQYLPGDRLPPSRDLASQLGVSVGTLREAIKGLALEGVVEMQRGPAGGVVVPTFSSATGPQATELALASLHDLLQLRRAVEGDAATLAARNRSDQQLEMIQRAFDTMEADVQNAPGGRLTSRFHRADAKFHRLIADASGNFLFRTITDAARARMNASMGLTVRSAIDDGRRFHTGHEAILRAIRRAQPAAAGKAARRHVDVAQEEIWRAVAPLARY